MRKPMLAGILAVELALVGAAFFYHQSQADKSSQASESGSKTYKVYPKAEKSSAKDDKTDKDKAKAKPKSKKKSKK